MAVYLILMALVLVLAYPLIEHKPNVVKKLCYVIVTFGAMYLISVFRYGLGNDYNVCGVRTADTNTYCVCDIPLQ